MTAGVGTGPDSTLGTILQSRRHAQGLTLAQASASTRIRIAHLAAIEAGMPGTLPAPVYARGYVRAYARYLGLDPDEMVALLPAPPEPAPVSAFHGAGPASRFVLTGPVAVVVVAILIGLAVTVYAWRQIESVSPPAGPPSSVHPLAVPSLTPLPSPSPTPQPLVVVVRVTDTVWLNVSVDGKPQYGDAGVMLQPGAVVTFTGFDIKITSGKAAATFITINGNPVGALGNGVVTREFKAPH